MFFTKKKKPEELREIPVEEAKRLSASGMSDKEIIRKLKSEGYSYSEIEKAMLAAVKEGVSNAPEATSTPSQEEAFALAPQPQEAELPSEFLREETKPPIPELKAPEFEEEAPETLIEEIVESIVDEKWEKFSKQLNKMNEDVNKANEKLKKFEEKIKNLKNQQTGSEFSSHLNDLSNRVEDLEARVGGLERAFRQFLPSLTDNIEDLSKIVNKIKSEVKK